MMHHAEHVLKHFWVSILNINRTVVGFMQSANIKKKSSDSVTPNKHNENDGGPGWHIALMHVLNPWLDHP